uniref:Uncharacterized protein n=1 Tax=Knipowitschia caucasica TaxID=637954 RepID=A0AAV2MK44_KNICA
MSYVHIPPISPGTRTNQAKCCPPLEPLNICPAEEAPGYLLSPYHYPPVVHSWKKAILSPVCHSSLHIPNTAVPGNYN